MIKLKFYGQDLSILEQYLQSIKIGKFLFNGPYGVGKMTAAMAYAACVIKGETTLKFKDIMDSMESVIIINGLTDGVVDVREKISEFFRNKSDQRVVIIDNANYANHNIQNFLLKTIEEKESHIIVINHDEVIPAIASRLVAVDFYPLSIEDMRKLYNVSEILMKTGSPGIVQSVMSDAKLLKIISELKISFSKLANYVMWHKGSDIAPQILKKLISHIVITEIAKNPSESLLQFAILLQKFLKLSDKYNTNYKNYCLWVCHEFMSAVMNDNN